MSGASRSDELTRTPRRRYENTWVDGEGAGAMIPDPNRSS
jgi:hypothetical protein